jgi:CRP-like cAMP-binding protein
MHGNAKPKIRNLKEGDTLVKQGESGTDVYLILDGMFVVEANGEAIAEIGPGAIVGERAALTNGARTATLWARTPGRVASVPADALDQDALSSLASTHHREE